MAGDGNEAMIVHMVMESVRTDSGFLEFLRETDPDLFAQLPKIVARVRAAERMSGWRGVSARPDQLLPGTPGSFSTRTDWRTWLIMGGRGGGKSRSAAEALRELLILTEWQSPPRCALVSTTLDAVRIDMVEGQIEPIFGDEIRQYNRSNVELWLKNGAFLKGYSSERPRRLRGPNFHLAWADEPANWLDAHLAPSEDSTWSNLEFATRLDDGGRWSPRIVATTTPKPVRLLRVADPADDHYPGIVDDPDTVISNVRTMDNIQNLAEVFRKRVIGRYAGTRLGAQELEGRLLSAAEHALFSPELISALRIRLSDVLLPGRRGLTVVGVDPSVGDGTKDECGIVVVSRLNDNEGFSGDSVAVVDDRSMRGRPSQWAEAVVKAFRDWDADYVAVEVNQGGKMVADTLLREAPNLPIKEVWARRGKEVRLEPVALMADQGRVRFAGSFLLLEDQLCLVEGSLILTARGHVPIEDVRAGDEVWTRSGWAPVAWSGQTGESVDTVSVFHEQGCVTSTGCHPIFDSRLGEFVPARLVSPSVRLLAEPSWASSARLSSIGAAGTAASRAAISGTRRVNCSTAAFGSTTSVRSQMAGSSTTSTTTRGTTTQRIWLPSRTLSTPSLMAEAGTSGTRRGVPSNDGPNGPSGNPPFGTAGAAGQSSRPSLSGPTTALQRAASSTTLPVPVFNLMVAPGHLPEYFADGVLVHNCTFEPASGRDSPDRLDAFVYAVLLALPPREMPQGLVSTASSGVVASR